MAKCCKQCIYKEYNSDKKPICREVIRRNKTESIFNYIYIIYDNGMETCEFFKENIY